jgi:hypothetical protein
VPLRTEQHLLCETCSCLLSSLCHLQMTFALNAIILSSLWPLTPILFH